MSAPVVEHGETVLQDPGEKIVRQFNWTAWLQELSATAEIASSSWALTGPDNGLTKDTPSVVTGNLMTQIRVIGGTPGKTYRLTNTVVSNETPAQTGVKWIEIAIRD